MTTASEAFAGVERDDVALSFDHWPPKGEQMGPKLNNHSYLDRYNGAGYIPKDVIGLAMTATSHLLRNSRQSAGELGPRIQEAR